MRVIETAARVLSRNTLSKIVLAISVRLVAGALKIEPIAPNAGGKGSTMNRCIECGGSRVVTKIPYDIDCLKDGKLWPVHIDELTVIKCLDCDEVYFTNQTDDEITAGLERVSGANHV
jgi:hypothetical protein